MFKFILAVRCILVIPAGTMNKHFKESFEDFIPCRSWEWSRDVVRVGGSSGNS